MSSSDPRELVSQEQAVFLLSGSVCAVFPFPLSPREAKESLTSPGFWDLLSMSFVLLRESFLGSKIQASSAEPSLDKQPK